MKRCVITFAAVLSLAVAFVLAVGCTTTGATTGAAPELPEAAPATTQAWWNVDIQFAWNPDHEPHWAYDLMCADRVIYPVYQKFQRGIGVWWFHRRAAPDESGHLFSFYFSADAATAQAVFARVKQQPLFMRLKEQGHIKKIDMSPEDRHLNGTLDGVVDASWPIELRRAWPDYAMGISRIWYNLVVEGDRHETAPGANASFDELDAHYTKVNAFVTAQWQAFGRHALFHHANAMFGYVPLPMRF